MRRRWLLGGLGLAVVGGRAARASGDLWERLRAGGLVLLMRHARTEPGTGDPPGYRLDDCTTQRNLSELGRAEARAIGAELRRRAVPVERVATSAWCRCRETAELLDLGPVARLEALDSFFDDRSRAAERTAALRAFLAGWSGPGCALLVTHQVNVTAATGVVPAPGELVVVEPRAPAAAPLGRLVPVGDPDRPLAPRTG
jgi:phosphohistidine phosphatase SixA